MDGVGPTMSMEDLSAGFYNLVKLQERDFKAINDIGQCVLTNADLLNTTITKVNTYEVVTVLAGQGLDQTKADLRFGLTKRGRARGELGCPRAEDRSNRRCPSQRSRRCSRDGGLGGAPATAGRTS